LAVDNTRVKLFHCTVLVYWVILRNTRGREFTAN